MWVISFRQVYFYGSINTSHRTIHFVLRDFKTTKITIKCNSTMYLFIGV